MPRLPARARAGRVSAPPPPRMRWWGWGVDGHVPGTAAVLLRDELGADDDRYPQVGVGPDGAGEIRVAADRE